MQAEDRTIHFSAELIHQPRELDRKALQRLYFDLSQHRSGAYDSTDFTNPVQPRFYTRRPAKTQSVAMFLPDRILLIEEWADIAFSDFLERVRTVAGLAVKARGVSQFVAHTGMVRSTFALSHFDDARVFLIDHACGQAGRVDPYFKRPVAVGGLRFVLPETNEHAGTFHVIIESFRHSLNEVFVEVKGVFGRGPIGVEDMSIVEDNLRSVRAFIGDELYNYLNQFDQPRTPPAT